MDIDITVLHERIMHELSLYTQARLNDINRGAETPELAALMVEKYAYGMLKTLNLADLDEGKLIDRIDQLLVSIDPNVIANREARWQARPASLSLNQMIGS